MFTILLYFTNIDNNINITYKNKVKANMSRQLLRMISIAVLLLVGTNGHMSHD